MNEKQLRQFVERWNFRVEEFWIYPWLAKRPTILAVGMEVIDLLDDLMTTHDTPSQQWVEASAVSADGSVFWARVDARTQNAEWSALERAKYLARTRTKTPSPY